MPSAVRPAAWLLLAMVILAGCAQPRDGAAPIQPGTAPRQSTPLTFWDRFPIDQQPRPILLNPPDQQLPATPNGFRTDAAKLAFLCGRVELPTTSLSPAPATALVRWPDGTVVGYPAAPLAKIHAWASAHRPAIANPDCGSRAALPVTRVRLGTAAFGTDRGRAQMTAWLLSTPDGRDQLAYPAVDPDRFFFPPPPQRLSSHLGFATLSRDGRSLTLTVLLRAGSACDPGERYGGVRVAESASAVMITVHATTPPNQTKLPKNAVCYASLPISVTTVTATLAHPLGSRVLVDQNSEPVTVCPASTARRTGGGC